VVPIAADGHVVGVPLTAAIDDALDDMLAEPKMLAADTVAEAVTLTLGVPVAATDGLPVADTLTLGVPVGVTDALAGTEQSYIVMRFTRVDPAIVNSPPTYRSDPFTVRAYTPLSTPTDDPVCSAENADPFQRAMWLNLTDPTVVNHPPTYRSDPITARACISPPTPTDDPVCSAENADPFQRAILFTVTDPAVVNHPPTYRSGPITARAYTSPPPTPTDDPIRSAENADPFQRAI
jgi:hypothetical protein